MVQPSNPPKPYGSKSSDEINTNPMSLADQLSQSHIRCLLWLALPVVDLLSRVRIPVERNLLLFSFFFFFSFVPTSMSKAVVSYIGPRWSSVIPPLTELAARRWCRRLFTDVSSHCSTTKWDVSNRYASNVNLLLSVAKRFWLFYQRFHFSNSYSPKQTFSKYVGQC